MARLEQFRVLVNLCQNFIGLNTRAVKLRILLLDLAELGLKLVNAPKAEGKETDHESVVE